MEGEELLRAFSIRIHVVVWTGENDTETIIVDANLFENGTKQYESFSLENGVLWTGS